MSGAVERIPGIRFDAPGNYLLEVRSGGGGLRAIANPIRVSALDRTVHWAGAGSNNGRYGWYAFGTTSAPRKFGPV